MTAKILLEAKGLLVPYLAPRSGRILPSSVAKLTGISWLWLPQNMYSSLAARLSTERNSLRECRKTGASVGVSDCHRSRLKEAGSTVSMQMKGCTRSAYGGAPFIQNSDSKWCMSVCRPFCRQLADNAALKPGTFGVSAPKFWGCAGWQNVKNATKTRRLRAMTMRWRNGESDRRCADQIVDPH
jgi:hypothetical protein